MKCVTLIPTYRNDGSKVSRDELKAIYRRFWETFGGCTIEGRTKGVWMDGDGKRYRDKCLKFVLVTESERLGEVEKIVREVGKQLGQLEMFFEVTHFDGVRFLKID